MHMIFDLQKQRMLLEWVKACFLINFHILSSEEVILGHSSIPVLYSPLIKYTLAGRMRL